MIVLITNPIWKKKVYTKQNEDRINCETHKKENGESWTKALSLLKMDVFSKDPILSIWEKMFHHYFQQTSDGEIKERIVM